MEYFIKLGRSLAPLYYNFASFVKEHASSPILVSYRSGHPIKHALDHLGVESKEFWINRSVAHFCLSNPVVRDYCIQQGIENCTLVDNGYKGTISSSLKQSFPQAKINTMLLLDMNLRKKSHTAFIGMHDNADPDYFVDHDLAKALKFKIETIPKQHEPIMPDEIFQVDKNGIPFAMPITDTEGKKRFDKFLAGMTEGYDFCTNDSEQFCDYLDQIQEVEEETYASVFEKADELLRRVEKVYV